VWHVACGGVRVLTLPQACHLLNNIRSRAAVGPTPVLRHRWVRPTLHFANEQKVPVDDVVPVAAVLGSLRTIITADQP